MRRTSWTTFLVMVAALASPQWASGQPQDPLHTQKALLADAGEYARNFGVGIEESLRRLKLQDRAGDLSATLTAHEAHSIGGVWIDHEPVFRVVVQVVGPGTAGRIGKYLRPGSDLEKVVEIQEVAHSLRRLTSDQRSAHRILSELGLQVDSEIDVRENRVVFYALDPGAAEAALASAGRDLSQTVVVRRVETLARPVNSIYAGLPLTTCTSGFAVRNGSGTTGILTAGHCPNSQAYGISLTFEAQSCGNGNDYQWHTSVWDEHGWFKEGSNIRSVSGTKHYNNQAVGAYVCKQGMTSGLTCGTIQSKTFQPTYSQCSPHTPTYVRVSNGSNMVDPGDSGGPVFSGTTAYGLVICEIFSNDLCYMAINRVSGLGLTVITGDPYPPPPPSCEESCWNYYDFCEEEYCYWNYDQYMCQQGCDEWLDQCLAGC